MPRSRTAQPESRHLDGLPLLPLAVAIAAAGLLVDPWADAAFDAPKRLGCMLAITAAAAFAAASTLPPARRLPRPAWSRSQWTCAASFCLALLGTVVAAAFSPRSAHAFDALRVILTYALLVPLGASRWLMPPGGQRLTAVFVTVTSINAILCVGERFGHLQLFPIAATAGRMPVQALVGNEGHLSIVFALAVLVCLGTWIGVGSTARARLWTGLGLILNAVGLAATGGLTAIIALGAGGGVLLAAAGGRLRRRAAAVAIALTLLVLAVPATRERLHQVGDSVRTADWDRLTTYRLGPWAAALEMARARPASGFGPGTFGAEFVEHRLQAELRYHRRFVPPHILTSYAQAHNEFLQVLAEAGWIVAAAALTAWLSLIGGLLMRGQNAPTRAAGERWTLLALLVAGAVAALTWFPLQIPLSATVLLLSAGRAFRLLADDTPGEIRRQAPPTSLWLRLGIAVACGVWLWPEVQRLAAEHQLAAATGGLRAELQRRDRPPAAETLSHIANVAHQAGEHLPGDGRVGITVGAAELVAGRFDSALAAYCGALALGERAEIDLNLGRALAKQDRRALAFAAFLRTAWVNPALLSALPTAAQPLAQDEMARLAEELTAGRLRQAPALPREVCPGLPEP